MVVEYDIYIYKYGCSRWWRAPIGSRPPASTESTGVPHCRKAHLSLKQYLGVPKMEGL